SSTRALALLSERRRWVLRATRDDPCPLLDVRRMMFPPPGLSARRAARQPGRLHWLARQAKGGSMPPAPTPDPAVLAVARQAAGMVADGAKVGLGTGRAAAAFVDELGGRVRQGLRIVGAATSEATARQAEALGITMIDLDENVILDLTVD